MPDIPAEAIRRAVAARSHALIDRPDPMVLSDETLTRMMLEAAAPAMAEAVAAKILAHRKEHEPTNRLIGGTPAEEDRRRKWRRYFGIAAQVAALAFTTDDDRKRMAVDAIARGDIAVCHDDGHERGQGEP